MEESINEKIEKIYTDKQLKINKVLEKKRKLIEEKYPDIADLEKQITNIAIDSSRVMIFSAEKEKEKIQKEMEEKIFSIRNEIYKLYKKYNIPLDYLKPKYDCDECKDTGYIENNGEISYCKCYKQLLALETYKSYNINKLDSENFENFDSSYYSEESNKERYGSNISPRKNIEKIKASVIDFIENFENTDVCGILFSGKPGLGKTFMSNCIAKEILGKGYSVIYSTLSDLLDKSISYKFSNSDYSNEMHNRIFNVDLLIIDDAGAENMNSQRHEELFEIIDKRILANKKTIISTNLSIDELYVNYDERVISRILGKYKKYKFYGEDIRLKKI